MRALGIWEEAVGIFRGLGIEGDVLKVTFNDSDVIPFFINSPESEILKSKLGDQCIGKKVSILRTDIDEKAILVRILGGSEEA